MAYFCVPLIYGLYHFIEPNVHQRMYSILHLLMVSCILAAVEYLLRMPHLAWVVLPPMASTMLGPFYSWCVRRLLAH